MLCSERIPFDRLRKRILANLLSCNYLEKTVQQTDLSDLLTLSCQHVVRSKPF